jgi:hypothetical protein
MVPPFQQHRLRVAARVLANGGVVAYPTEAVYGLGCDPWDGMAVDRILRIKGRHRAKGLILIAADPAQLLPFVEPLPPGRMTEILATWPGPNTWLLPARPTTPAWLTGRFDTLAVRVTAHPLAAGAGLGNAERRQFVLHLEDLVFEPSDGFESVLAFEKGVRAVAGVVSESKLEDLGASAWLVAANVGRGKLVLFADDPLFRLMWPSQFVLFTNALLLGPNM